MKRDYYTTPKPSRTMRFFWKAAGGDRFILERSTYSDQIKYMCLGGIIVATGVMAAIAGGYAFYTIFEPRGSAMESGLDTSTAINSVVFGLFWGLMIFNLDRFIVSSTGKGDGTEAITWDELKGAIPRIIMGAIIALTISKPVEIRMFKSEIDVELRKAQMEQQGVYLSAIEANFSERIDNERKKISDWKDEINAKEAIYLDAVKELNMEMSGDSGPRGYGPEAQKKEELKDDARQEWENTKLANQPLIDQAFANLQDFEAQKQEEIVNSKKAANGLDGLLERIKLAHAIAGFWISLFITLLFMAIELTPIFFKLMLIKSPYDFLKDNVEELMKAERGIYVQYNYHQDKQGQERDLVTYLEKEKIILEKRALQEVQEELTEYAIAKYRDNMKAKIDENPEAFVQVHSANNEERTQ